MMIEEVNTNRHILKSFRHNGIYVPPYDYKGFSVKIQGQAVKLTEKSEQMATAWVKKTMSKSPPDKVFYKNFIQDFLAQLQKENPTLTFLSNFTEKYLSTVNSDDFNAAVNDTGNSEIDFSEIAEYIALEKEKKAEHGQERKETSC
jgi:hypothetical protein